MNYDFFWCFICVFTDLSLVYLTDNTIIEIVYKQLEQ